VGRNLSNITRNRKKRGNLLRRYGDNCRPTGTKWKRTRGTSHARCSGRSREGPRAGEGKRLIGKGTRSEKDNSGRGKLVGLSRLPDKMRSRRRETKIPARKVPQPVSGSRKRETRGGSKPPTKGKKQAYVSKTLAARSTNPEWLTAGAREKRIRPRQPNGITEKKDPHSCSAREKKKGVGNRRRRSPEESSPRPCGPCSS